MGKVESDGPKGIDALRRLPEDRILVPVPMESPEYQAYLEANRRREQAREEFGGPDPKAEEAYREAAQKVSHLSRKIYSQRRAS